MNRVVLTSSVGRAILVEVGLGLGLCRQLSLLKVEVSSLGELREALVGQVLCSVLVNAATCLEVVHDSISDPRFKSLVLVTV